jgi:two-component SAPR family response regulator
LRVLAFGVGRVLKGETEIGPDDWQGQLPRELFFYLFFNAPVRKSQIGVTFWPDETPESVNRRLFRLVYRTRQTVGAPFVIFQHGAYCWNPQVTFWCDVQEFREVVEEIEALPPDDTAHSLLERAISLYPGDFLEEFDSDWCCFLRDELREKHLRTLLYLGRIFLEQEDLSRAEELFLAALRADGLREAAYRGLMRCYHRMGQRTRALQLYRDCRRRLSQELNVLPSDETQSLYRAIAREQELPLEGAGS